MRAKYKSKSPIIYQDIDNIPLNTISIPLNVKVNNLLKNYLSIKSSDNILYSNQNIKTVFSGLFDNSNLLESKNDIVLKKSSSYIYKINSAKTLSSLTDSHSIILIQSIFRGYLVRSKNKLNNRNNFIYKRKKPVIQMEFKKKRGILLSISEKNDNKFKKFILINNSIHKRIINKNHYFSKIIMNKKNNNILLKIIFLQKFWKIIYKKKILEKKVKSLLTDYRQNTINNNTELVKISQSIPYYNKAAKKYFRSIRHENDIVLDEGFKENQKKISINGYNSNLRIGQKILNSRLKTNYMFDEGNRSLGTIYFNTFGHNDDKNYIYTKRITDRYILNDLVNPNIKNCKNDNSKIFSKKKALNLNKTPDVKKFKVIFEENYDAKNLNNNTNIWKKNELKFKYKNINRFVFRDLKPNKHFILVETNKNEKKLILNNNKHSIILKPIVNKLKKINSRTNKNKSYIKTKLKKNNTKNDSGKINITNLSMKATEKKKKIIINVKQKILNKYNISKIKDNEPLLVLERKLIMQKPDIINKIKRKK